MNESLQAVCSAFIESRDCLKKVFRMENSHLYPVCADIFVSAEKTPDPDVLNDCKKMIRQSTGIFSNFRGNTIMPLASTLAADKDPQARWERTQENYKLLKSQFFGTEFLALAASMLAENPDSNAADLAERGKSLFKRMRKEHPFLTGQEDSVLALLLVQGSKTEDELITEMEACYKLLNKRLPKGDGLQTSAHALTLFPNPPEEKCERMLALYDAISARCKKFGRYYELPILAALSYSDKPVEAIAEDVEQVFSFLKTQKGYRSIFGFVRKERLMHAAMLVSAAYSIEQKKEGTDVSTLIAQQSSLLIAIVQQIMLTAIIASSAASTASSSAAR